MTTLSPETIEILNEDAHKDLIRQYDQWIKTTDQFSKLENTVKKTCKITSADIKYANAAYNASTTIKPVKFNFIKPPNETPKQRKQRYKEAKDILHLNRQNALLIQKINLMKELYKRFY